MIDMLICTLKLGRKSVVLSDSVFVVGTTNNDNSLLYKTLYLIGVMSICMDSYSVDIKEDLDNL